MPSTFSWLDYSEKDRQRAQTVIDSLREHDTRDELGIGTVRDSLSDLLFPGTTTLQTRPKYLLLVPWVFQAVEIWADKGRSFSELNEQARWRELNLLDHLMKAEDKEGVIGREAGKKLLKLPSNIYWNGLRVLGIRAFPGSAPQLLRVFAQGRIRRLAVRVEADEAPIEESGFWHAGMPPRPKDFPFGQTLALSGEEATYLKDRILSQVGGSLMAWLVDSGDFGGDAGAPWQHPQIGELPEDLARQLEHARVFAELMQGAAFFYNLMLAEKRGDSKLIGDHRKNLAAWAEAITAQRDRLTRWDREDFWKTVTAGERRITGPTRSFINSWLDLALGADDPSVVRESRQAKDLLDRRETQLKGLRRARLHEPRALEMWNGNAGTRPMTYRWNIVQAMVKDIAAGLNGGASDA